MNPLTRSARNREMKWVSTGKTVVNHESADNELQVGGWEEEDGDHHRMGESCNPKAVLHLSVASPLFTRRYLLGKRAAETGERRRGLRLRRYSLMIPHLRVSAIYLALISLLALWRSASASGHPATQPSDSPRRCGL